MPLHYLSDKEEKFFVLDGGKDPVGKDLFRMKDAVAPYWKDDFFRELVRDRNDFTLKRYFYRKNRQVEDRRA